jgi:hypothetical protein
MTLYLNHHAGMNDGQLMDMDIVGVRRNFTKAIRNFCGSQDMGGEQNEIEIVIYVQAASPEAYIQTPLLHFSPKGSLCVRAVAGGRYGILYCVSR